MKREDLLEIDKHCGAIEKIFSKQKIRLDREYDVLWHNVKQFRYNLKERSKLFKEKLDIV